MEKTQAIMMKELVNGQKYESTADALQQVMEEKPGCEKRECMSEEGEESMSKSYRNRHSEK